MSDYRSAPELAAPEPPAARPRDDASASPRALARGLWRPAAVIALIAAAIAVVQPGEIAENTSQMRQWARDQGGVGLLLFLGFYVVASICLVPQSGLKIASGALFGSILGVAVASAGTILGATACFVIARYVARGTLLQHLKQKPKFQRLDHMTGEHGAIIVATSRLVPIIPGNLLNYLFGLTKVRLETFAVWSWICTIPGIVVLVVGTNAAVRALEEGRVPWALLAIVAGVLAGMFVTARFLYRNFRQRQHGSPDSDPDGP